MSPVVFVTASMPRRKANASTGVILRTKGSMRASVVGPPRPGRMTDDEPDRHADQHQPERGPGEDLDQPGQAGVEEVGYRSSSRGLATTASGDALCSVRTRSAGGSGFTPEDLAKKNPDRPACALLVPAAAGRQSYGSGARIPSMRRIPASTGRRARRARARGPGSADPGGMLGYRAETRQLDHGHAHAHARLRRLRPHPSPPDRRRAAARRGAQGAPAGARGDVLPDGAAPRLRRGGVLAVHLHRAARPRRATGRHPGLPVLRVPALGDLRARATRASGSRATSSGSAWACPSTT